MYFLLLILVKMNLKILLLCSFVCLFSIHAKAATKSEDPSTVYAVTWNVNEGVPPASLKELLGQTSSTNPDIVIVGLQEVTMDKTKAPTNANKWTGEIDKLLNSNNNYYKVHTESLVSVLLNVYVKTKYKPLIKENKGTKISTSPKDTKGAVIIKFQLNNRWYCIVNSHLPAHDEKLQDRIKDYKTIDGTRAKHCNKPSDYVFWLGDLNFRLDEKLQDTEIRNLVIKKQYEKLLKDDQLTKSKDDKKIFDGFKEAQIKFPPTFKLEIGKGTYSLQRRPAWTDRVLYKSENSKTITSTLYNYVPGYKQSDHFPVQAQFKI